MSFLKEVWQFRELFYFLAWRDIKIRYTQTLLGVAWAVIQPVFTMLVFTFMFGNLAGMPSDGTPHALFYFSALLPWTYFSSMLTTVGNSLLSNSSLLTKVYFPRIILPVSTALAGLLDLLIGSLFLGVIMLYYHVAPSPSLLLWPVLAVPLLAATVGIGIILAALNVRYRDVKYAIPFGVQLLLFLTPIIYPISFFPERYRFILALNPLTGIIEAFRATLLPARSLDWQSLSISLVMTTLIFSAGVIYFRKTEREFADIV
jgi:lipopolysaccharide transport system permease protein